MKIQIDDSVEEEVDFYLKSTNGQTYSDTAIRLIVRKDEEDVQIEFTQKDKNEIDGEMAEYFFIPVHDLRRLLDLVKE